MPAPTEAPVPRRWAAAAVMIVAALMDMIDVTIVNVSLPSLARDLGASQSALQWTISAYLLGFAASLVVSGHLGDRYGRRRLFLLGTAAFGVASLACGSAQEPGQLVAARAVQGVAAAVLLPQVLGSFRTLFHGRERATVFGIFGTVLGFASALGLLLGGLLTDADLFGWGWRSIFLINVPVALLAFVAARAVVPPDGRRSTARPDLLGSLLLAAGLVGVVLPLVQGRSWGWPLWGWVCMGAGAGLVAMVAGVQSRRGGGARTPLLPARAFRSPAFGFGLAVQLLFSFAMQGFFLVFGLWLQVAQQYTPTQAGVVTVAFSSGGFVTSPIAGALAVRYGRWVLVTGGLLMAGGYAWTGAAVGGADAVRTGAWPLVPGLLVAGAGLGLLVVPLVNVVLSAVDGELAGRASGIFSTAQQFGGALGVAAIGSVFFRRAADGLGDALLAALPWATSAAAVCALLCLRLPRTAVAEEAYPEVPEDEGASDRAAV